MLFDSDKTIDQVGNLAEAMNFNRPPRDAELVQGNFVVCCRLLACRIMIRAIEVKIPEPPPTVKEIANEIRANFKGTKIEMVSEHVEKLLKDGEFETVSKCFKEMAAQIKSQLKNDGSNEIQDPK